MKVVCGRQDCIHNTGCGCSINSIAIGKDLQCQNYHQTWDKDAIIQEENSIKIMTKIKLKQDSKEAWATSEDSPYPYTTAKHSFHTDWNNEQKHFGRKVEIPVPVGEDK